MHQCQLAELDSLKGNIAIGLHVQKMIIFIQTHAAFGPNIGKGCQCRL